MQRVTPLVLLLMLAAGAGACAGKRSQVIEDAPTLIVPPVPPRTIEPRPTEPPPIEPVLDLPPAPTVPAKPKPAPRNDAKPEPKPEPAPESTTTTAPANPPPVAPLRTATTPSGPEAAKLIHLSLSNTDSILSRVDYQKLSTDRRATYDSAKRFKQQGDEALKKEDLTNAQRYAERAESIARQLCVAVGCQPDR
jgi:outer membrane biosynthesis protein TonB